MCEQCSTTGDYKCHQCGGSNPTEGASFVGGTRYQAGGVTTTDCGDCGHTMECPDTSPEAQKRPR